MADSTRQPSPLLPIFINPSQSNYPDMNPTVRAMWIAALRSPGCGQCVGTLKQNDAYSAAGVLCALYLKQNKRHAVSWKGNEMPSNVRRWAGVAPACWISPPNLAEYKGAKLGRFDFRVDEEEMYRRAKSLRRSDEDIELLVTEWRHSRLWRTLREWNDTWLLTFEEISNLLEFGLVNASRRRNQ